MKRALSIAAIFFLIAVFCIPVTATKTGFQLEAVSESESTAFLEKADIQSVDTPPEKGNIISFNVSGNRIALAIEPSGGYSRKFLCIYDLDGVFLKGYSFNSREFGMDFDGDNIFIYFDVTDIAVYLSATGQVEGVYSIPFDNNLDCWDHIYAKKRKIDNVEYCMENSSFRWPAVHYAQLVVRDAAGNEHILYDNSIQRNTNIILMIGFWVLFFAVAGAILVYGIKKHKRLNKTRE